MKVLKILGIATLLIIAILLLLIVFGWGSVALNSYSKKKEAIRYQKEVCDTIKTVQGNFPLKFDGFTKKELRKIHFYLQQDKLLIRDTVISFVPKNDDETQTINLPFNSFNIDNRLIVEAGKRYFVLSDYSYTAGYNYGMFGPVGSCECKSNGFKTLNGEPAGSGWLIKKYGLLNYQLPKGRF